MPYIEWTDMDSVGIPSIDEQHMQLVNLTNTLFMAIMEERGESVIMETLTGLAHYAEEHFAAEESLLLKHGFPQADFDSHVIEHRKLTDQVFAFIKQARKNPRLLDLAVFDFLRDWMADHLQATDSEYSAFLKARGVS